MNCQRAEVSRLLISRQRNWGRTLVPQIGHNVCASAVARFRSRHCPRGQTLNEDNTLNLHVTPPLRKHFVGGCVALESLYVRCYVKLV